MFTWDELVSGGELTVKLFKYTQYGRSVRLQRQLQINIRATIQEIFPGNVSSGKMTTRETSFRESDHPGIVIPGNVLSGENDHPGSVFPGKNHPGK